MSCQIENRMSFKAEKIERNIIAERKLTNETVVKIMMVVREFRLGKIVFMIAMFFRKLLDQVLIGVHRLKQYCEQYANQER